MIKLIISLLLIPPVAFADAVNLAWDPSPTPQVAGYEIMYGGSPGVNTVITDVGNAVAASITGLLPGKTYYFRARAYNAGKTVFSVDSNEVSQAILLILQAPINLRIVP